MRLRGEIFGSFLKCVVRDMGQAMRQVALFPIFHRFHSFQLSIKPDICQSATHVKVKWLSGYPFSSPYGNGPGMPELKGDDDAYGFFVPGTAFGTDLELKWHLAHGTSFFEAKLQISKPMLIMLPQDLFLSRSSCLGRTYHSDLWSLFGATLTSRPQMTPGSV